MKKKLFILIICIFGIFLSSCKKKEYGLIEISAYEFNNYLYNEDRDRESVNIVYAVYSSSSKDAEQFLDDLEKVARRTKTLIYYLDYEHLDFLTSFMLEESAPGDNYYCVIQDGQVIVFEEYKDYDTLYKNINGKQYYPDIEFASQEYIDEQMEKAKEEFDKGRYTGSLNFLNLIWNVKEAKDFYNDHNEFNLVHFWVGYIPTGNDEDIHYFGLSVGFFFNTLTIYDKLDKVEGFKEPTDGKMYYYYVKDGYFYISEKEDGEYKKSYKIVSLTKDKLIVKVNNINLGMNYVY